MRRLAALLAALAASVSLPLSATAWDNYPTLNDTASWLAQRPVTVHCLTKRESELDLTISFWGAVAYVGIVENDRPANYTVVAYPWCKVLRALRAGHAEAWSSWHVVVAVLILTHEAGHLRGGLFPPWKNEALVNCWAIRRVAAVAVLRFGVPVEAMPAFNHIAAGIYRHQPLEYRMRGCLSVMPGA